MFEMSPGPQPLETLTPIAPAAPLPVAPVDPAADTATGAGRRSLDNLRLLYEGVRCPRPARLWTNGISDLG
ncbi:MAG: hypothetical protein SFX72_16730 [Isosphaeraceae bacterium]|nr:hypothetical protein [Isosphaeraceae bacterium]